MKKISVFLFLFTTIAMAGCKKNFLDVPIQGQGVASLDPQVAINDVTGAYNALITPDPTPSGFGQYDIHGVYFITVTNIIADDADKGSFAGGQPLAADIDNFQTPSDKRYVAGLWRG